MHKYRAQVELVLTVFQWLTTTLAATAILARIEHSIVRSELCVAIIENLLKIHKG